MAIKLKGVLNVVEGATTFLSLSLDDERRWDSITGGGVRFETKTN